MISIIVPVYNAEKYIVDTIKMVLAQTFTDWELLLIDDCSTDKSMLYMDDFLAGLPEEEQKKIKLIKSDKNGGVAKARNAGLYHAAGQYLAFLDADDIWLKDKLLKQINFMKETEAAFSFTAYEFGNEQAIGTGKIVFVPPTLCYREALSRTVIFTSTTLFDIKKMGKELLEMPEVKSEDTAAWWKILRNGHIAYGLNEVTTIYRRPPNSMSANKIEAIKRIWFLYRQVEKLSLFDSMYNFILWAFRATLRRI